MESQRPTGFCRSVMKSSMSAVLIVDSSRAPKQQ